MLGGGNLFSDSWNSPYDGLWWPVMACDGLWWPVMACDGLWWPMMACDGLWWPMMACDGLWWPVMANDGLWWPVMACDGLWWPVIACDGLWWPVMAYDGLWWPVMACDGLWWPVMACDGLWWPVMACDGLWWLMMACDGLWWPVMACDGLWWPVMACDGLWWPVCISNQDINLQCEQFPFLKTVLPVFRDLRFSRSHCDWGRAAQVWRGNPDSPSSQSDCSVGNQTNNYYVSSPKLHMHSYSMSKISASLLLRSSDHKKMVAGRSKWMYDEVSTTTQSRVPNWEISISTRWTDEQIFSNRSWRYLCWSFRLSIHWMIVLHILLFCNLRINK